MAGSLIIFDTHPIQYRAPVFRVLAQRLPRFQVCFFNSSFDGKKWWFQENDKIPKQEFGLSLTEGYAHRILNTQSLGFLKKVGAIKEFLQQEKPRAILVYGYYQTEHWILRFLSAQLGIPLLFIGETYDWRGSVLRKKLKKHLVQFFFKRVAGFIAVGKKTESYYSDWGIDPRKITRGNYCTDPTPFLLSDEAAQELRSTTRRALGIPESEFVLLFVGRLFDRKRPQDLIKIHQSLQGREPVHTVIVGNGELQDWLEEQSQTLKKVYYVGFKNQVELKSFYYAADLLVVPSEFETWGLVVNEAFSCGLPALVTHQCGVAGDLVVPGITGEIYEVGAIDEAVRKVVPLVHSPQLAKKLGKSARDKVLSSFKPEQFAQSILQAFQKAISDSV